MLYIIRIELKNDDQKWKKIVLKKYLDTLILLANFLFFKLLKLNQLLELNKLYKTKLDASSKKKNITRILLEKNI